ncbi:alkyl hydroperoxide reductase [Planctomycetaceae bacterium SH139]
MNHSRTDRYVKWLSVFSHFELLVLRMRLVHCVLLSVFCLFNSNALGQIAKQDYLQFDMQGLDGQLYVLSQNDTRVCRAFVFLSTSCPISNSYLPELNRLAGALPRGVELYGVMSDPNTTRESALKHFTEYQAAFPVLFDGSQLMRLSLQPTHVPEAFVLDSSGGLVYRGAIDNAYESIGRRRVNVEERFLADAIAAVAAGRKPLLSQTKPVGCVLPPERTNRPGAEVTYARDIAPILQQRCETCHRPGQVAPFSLSSYVDAQAHADMIVEVTQRRLMPPWIPGPQAAHRFIGQRRLSDRELELLAQWVEEGCVLGDKADLPPRPRFVEGWQLGVPDLVVQMQEPFAVPAGGPDLLQNFVLPIEIPEDKLVAAVEFHPGNKRVVHHAVLFLDDKGQARKLDAATPEPGYGNFGGPGFLPSGALGGWSVGNTARRLPNDMGRYLKKDSDLVVQVHYHPTGKPEVDQSEVGLYFVDKPLEKSLQEPAKLVGSIWMANYEMDIPAGEANYRRSTSYTLPKDVIMVGIVPHMHLLGKSMRVTALQPNEVNEEVLIDIPQWDYNWQDEYYYEQPIRLQAGTKLVVEAVFDNSSDNPSNPSSPPQRVSWGEETTDEMLFCFFLITAERTEDLIHTIIDNLGHDLKQNRKNVEQTQ